MSRSVVFPSCRVACATSAGPSSRTHGTRVRYSINIQDSSKGHVAHFNQGKGLRQRHAAKQVTSRQQLQVTRSAASEDAAPAPTQQSRLPRGAEETTSQCKAAVLRAMDDGVKLMQVELLLPLIGATDLDDWPGGIRQQFKAAAPMVEDLLRGLPAVMAQGGCDTEILDQADAVGLWEGSAVAAVLFPTPETLPRIMDVVSKDESRPAILANAQWQGGQFISDFGVGDAKRRAEEFLNRFTTVYSLKKLRILGEDVQILYSYPGQWQVYVGNGGEVKPECIAALDEAPSYKELSTMLKSREGSKASMNVFQRLVSEFKFNADSLKNPPQ